jgi:hypothetical protein
LPVFFEVLSFEKANLTQETAVVLAFRFSDFLDAGADASSWSSIGAADWQNACFKQPEVTSRDARGRAFRDAGW